MQTVILAGGLGTRIQHLTPLPKAMIPVEGKPFLEYQIEILRKHSLTDIVLCVGHLHEKIEDYFGDGRAFGVSIRYSLEQGTLLGTGGALKKAEPLLDDHFFVMYGDSFLLLDYAGIEKAFQEHPGDGLMVVYRNHNQFDRSNVTLREGFVSGYGYEGYERKEYIDEGISVLRKDFFKDRDASSVFSLGDILKELIREKKLRAFETLQRFYEIGSEEGLETFRAWVLGRSNPS